MVSTRSRVNPVRGEISDEHTPLNVEATSSPQVEIALLQEKITQMEKDLEAMDNAMQGRDKNRVARNSRAGDEVEGRDDEEVNRK